MTTLGTNVSVFPQHSKESRFLQLPKGAFPELHAARTCSGSRDYRANFIGTKTDPLPLRKAKQLNGNHSSDGVDGALLSVSFVDFSAIQF